MFHKLRSSYNHQRSTESLSTVKKDLADGTSLAFSITVDAVKVVAAISIDARNKVLLGGAFPHHFVCLDGIASD